VRDRSVDLVLAIEVLEHIPQPQRMLGEACRVLRDDGRLILTTPFMFGEHDYHDYFRYTPRGMAELLGEVGMRVEQTVLRGGSFVSALGLLRNLVRDSIVGQPGGWRAHGRRKKLLWAVATVVMVPWVPVMYAALAVDRLVDRDSRSAPGYFFLCSKAPAALPGADRAGLPPGD
jgi:SAM-dependent methyltransferase